MTFVHAGTYADSEAEIKKSASKSKLEISEWSNLMAKSPKNDHRYARMTASKQLGSSESTMDENRMSDISKEVIDAKLAQNKAEVSAVASDMKTEMANFRTAYVESFSEISKTLSRIESKADATEKRLTQAQWIVSLVISICAVTLSAVIYFSNKSNSNPPQQPQAQTQVASQAPATDTQKPQ